MKNNIMPPLVLTVICTAVCALLVLAYNATYVDNTGVLTDELKSACEKISGKGEYEILLKASEGEKKEVVNFGDENVNAVIKSKDGKACLFEITEDGYAKGGLHIVVGIDEKGKVSGIEFLSIGETPGLGTNVENKDFLKKFKGVGDEKSAQAVDGVTGATYSSKGMKSAVARAVRLYNDNKEGIFRGR